MKLIHLRSISLYDMASVHFYVLYHFPALHALLICTYFCVCISYFQDAENHDSLAI